MNLYAYTYPSAKTKFENYVLVKFGDTIRSASTRINEQGGAAEYESKIVIGEWNGVKQIKRDYDVHKILTKLGLHHVDGKGTEWFKIPGNTEAEAFAYLDAIITELEGKKIRNKVKLRKLQLKSLKRALSIVKKAVKKGYPLNATIIANLCPRFGKTIWGLTLFNHLADIYNIKVMLLPAYWLSVHSSFIDELDQFDDFCDITLVDPNTADAKAVAKNAIKNDQKIIVPVSLHGDLSDWIKKHEWLKDLKTGIFMFADEGDFGTHADNQVKKIDYIFSNTNNQNVVKVFASGTNVQRLAKGSGKANGVIYSAYSQLEKTEADIVNRKFYMLEVDTLKQDVEQFDEVVQPSWIKIWGKPNGNKAFVSKLFLSLTGQETLRQELNLSNLTNESIDCFMMLVSANKKEMKQIKEIAERSVPNYHIKVLNGDYTNNKQAQYETVKEINEARIAGKQGIIIIANQMGSRSYSIPEIQATVIAYDRGSVDATVQKVSRCLTPGNTYNGDKKLAGHILDLSFDPNRSENIERILVDEIVQVSKSEDIDFPKATTFVLSSIDCFKVRYGTAVEVGEEEMFKILGNDESLLRVADVTVDVEAALDLIDDLANVKAAGKQGKELLEAINSAKNKVKEGGENNQQNLSDKDKQQLEKIINDAVRALNMSATSVFNLAGSGNSYRECIDIIDSDKEESEEFEELFGVNAGVVKIILDRELLNEPILDVIVQNTKNTIETPFVL